ncbi:MAG: thioesterase family protein [Prevotellaceae bacterium]|nr:thioesterase family protein [Candidatus Minthosoma caballi]
MLTEGLSHTSTITVSPDKTAAAVGSGDMLVLATPMMMALMENAAMLATAGELPEGMTTVGGHIESSHIKPSKIGAEVKATATLTKVEGKKLYFDIVATMNDAVIGQGTHLRFIVNKEKFMNNL